MYPVGTYIYIHVTHYTQVKWAVGRVSDRRRGGVKAVYFIQAEAGPWAGPSSQEATRTAHGLEMCPERLLLHQPSPS